MPQPIPALSQGRYQLVDELGSGGMAVVYRAHDSRLQVDRAIKLLNPTMMAHPQMRERFLGEARTMARLHHPNLMAVHDVGEEQGHIFIVMDLIEGGTLWDWVEDNGPMPARMAVEVMIQVLDGIDAAHEEGIVHRDLKPHNVLITPRGRPLISDFGIARVQDSGQQSLTRTGAAIGTLGFMAPEQRKHAKGVDERADLFALGATLYALLTAEVPIDIFASEIEAELRVQLPTALVPLVRKSTRYLPEDRFQDAQTMRQALQDVLAELPPIPEGTPALGGRRPRRDTPELNLPSAPSLSDDDDSGTLDAFVSGTRDIPPLRKPPPHSPVEATADMGIPLGRETSDQPRYRAPAAVGGPGHTRTSPDQDASEPPAAPGTAKPWIVAAAAALLGMGLIGGLWWADREATEAPTEPLIEQPTASSPEPEPPTQPVEPEPEPEPEPAVVEPEPVSPPEPEPAHPPEARATAPSPTPTKPAVEVDFPRVQVRLNADPWARWTMSGDAADSGASTPFIGRLNAPGTYHFELVTEDGRSHTHTVSLDGTRERVSECYSFAKDGDC